MAAVNLVPSTLNVIIQPGAGQFFQAPAVNTQAGAAIDLSAWVSLQAKLLPASANPAGADVSFGTTTANASGIVTLETVATDLASVSPGTARLLIVGKPTSGDPLQILCSGTATILNS